MSQLSRNTNWIPGRNEALRFHLQDCLACKIVLETARRHIHTSAQSSMPFAEIANAIFLTFVASEYHFVSDGSRSFETVFKSRANRAAFVLVVCINLLFRVTGTASVLKELMQDLFHVPKVLLAANLYILTLYADCRRIQNKLTVKVFIKRVGLAFLKVAPWYPFLAVIISFGFLFVISIWEALHLPLQWLNMPIYYGTLYGPFSMVYFNVKQKIMEEKTFLPTTQLEQKYVPAAQREALQAAIKRQATIEW